MSNSDFIAILFGAMGVGATPWVASFVVDPKHANGAWKGRAVELPAIGMHDLDASLPLENNNFFSVASVRGARNAVSVSGIHALVLDDVTVDAINSAPLPPTWAIETSPGNFQMGYRLENPESVDPERYTEICRMLADAASGNKCGGQADKSGNSAVRYARLPVGSNTKAEHVEANGGRPWRHLVHIWAPEHIYALSRITGAWGVSLLDAGPRKKKPRADEPKAASAPVIATPVECTQAERDRVVEALGKISSAKYDDWLKVGMALHSTGWLDGCDLWDSWSRGTTAGNYQPGACAARWRTFDGAGKVRLGTLFHMAGMARERMSSEDAFAKATQISGSSNAEACLSNLPIAVQAARADESRTFVHLSMPLGWEGFPDVIKDEDGNLKKLKATIENAEHLLKEYGVFLFANVYTKQPAAVLPGVQYLGKGDGEADDIVNQVLTLAERTQMPTKNLAQNLNTIARRNEYNAPREWFDHLEHAVEPDGKDYIQKVCDAIRVPEHQQAARDIAVRLFFLAACAAADGAGSSPNRDAIPKYEYVMVMVGGQGAQKTTWLRTLLPKELHEYMKTGVPLDPGDKDSVMAATSSWLVELGEVDATFRRSDVARMKAFLSNEVDEYRVPYGRMVSRWKRRTVFVASSNDATFLSDSTGNRRYLAYRVSELLPHGVDVEQLWLQAWRVYLGGAPWWPTAEEDAVLEAARAEFDEMANDPLVERLHEVFGPFTEERIDDKNLMRLTEIMTAIGVWDHSKRSEMNRIRNYLVRANVDEAGLPRKVNVDGATRWRMPQPKPFPMGGAAMPAPPADGPQLDWTIQEDGLPAFLH